MATQELSALPLEFSAGTTVCYRKSFADYPASAWVFTLYLAGKSILEVAAAADGEEFVLTIEPYMTEVDFEPGHYKYVERVSNGTEVYDVGSGAITVTANLAQAAEEEHQEWLEIAIAALEAHVQGRLPAGMESYSIAGRAVSKIPIKDALVLISQLKTKLARKKTKTGVTRKGVFYFTKVGYDT